MDVKFLSASLHLSNLDLNVTEDFLYEIFKKYGKKLTIHVCRDYKTNKSLGSAYVNYENVYEGKCYTIENLQPCFSAKGAMEGLNNKCIFNRPCRIMWSKQYRESCQPNASNVFIKNLSPWITSKKLEDIFSNFGEVTSCKVECNESGISKGFGYVNFVRIEDANIAIRKMNGKIIRDSALYVAHFVPKDHSGRDSRSKCTQRNVLPKVGLQRSSSASAAQKTAYVQYDLNLPHGDPNKKLCTKLTSNRPMERDEREKLKAYISPMVKRLVGNSSRRVTNAILDLDKSEVYCLLENATLMQTKVQEIVTGLRSMEYPAYVVPRNVRR